GALRQYHGTLIFISHDVHFIRAIATSVLHVTGGTNSAGSQLTFYPGDYDYYLDKSKAICTRTGLAAGSDSPGINGFAAVKASRQNGAGPRKQKEQKRLEAEAR
ncbi:MAG: ABC transporter ATP-binding protein, partial [Verrucomicrobia bacterium]